MDKVFVGLGSNLDKPLSQLQNAIESLRKEENIEFCQVSSFYRSEPMGPQEQPDYINAVVELKTKLSADDLLDVLQKIENNQGRVRKERWGARTLDLDILLYGDQLINSKRLTVPHIGISERNFVLYPLRDLLNADFYIPEIGKLSELLAACSMTGITRLDQV